MEKRNNRIKKKIVEKAVEIPEEIFVEETLAKDFEILLGAPVSEDDHFVFKTEKTWAIDTSKYSEYFTTDLSVLSAAIESTSFSKNIGIDKRYLTEDQLTSIDNNAQKAKENYQRIINNLNNKEFKESKEKLNEEIEDDLEFLLSLEEPIEKSSVKLSAFPSGSKISNISAPAKNVDLEKWLDAVLED